MIYIQYYILRIWNFLLLGVIRFFSFFNKKGTAVYMFHEVNSSENKIYSPYIITIKEFEEFLSSIPVDNIISISELNKNFLEKKFYKKVTITFDDVSESVYLNALKILRKYQIPFTLFVSLSLIDKKGYITTEQLLELSEDPYCTIGSHGIDHVYYRKLSKEECDMQFRDSKKKLEEIIKKEVNYFAFPYGSFFACSFENLLIAKNSSYKLMFSTIPEPITKSCYVKSYFLPRICVTSNYIKFKIS